MITLAEETDVDEIDGLLCLAREQIGLAQSFCASETRPRRVGWLNAKIAHQLLWIVRRNNDISGVLILEQDELARITGIAYIIVAEQMRGRRKIGPQLVQKAQMLADGGFLKAEARNDHSRRLLERCGFRRRHLCSSSGYPVLDWSRSTGD